jgi:hypothetical protein
VGAGETWVPGAWYGRYPTGHTPVVSAYALTATRLLPAKVRVFIDYLVANMESRAIPSKG